MDLKSDMTGLPEELDVRVLREESASLGLRLLVDGTVY